MAFRYFLVYDYPLQTAWLGGICRPKLQLDPNLYISFIWRVEWKLNWKSVNSISCLIQFQIHLKGFLKKIS